METIICQKSQETEVKAYTPNLHLELTPQSEIRRLRKVIDEKNDLIARFKKYDEERKAYYRRFEQNYEMMEEQYNAWREIVDEEVDTGTSRRIEKAIRKYTDRMRQAQSCIMGMNEVEKSLQNVISMLREMLTFAETRSMRQKTFYKTKIGSAIAYVDKLLTKVVCWKNK